MTLMNEADDMDDSIGKVLAGEASEEETAGVLRWIAESDANRNYFDQLKTIFEKSAAAGVEVHFDTDAAWAQVKVKLEGKGKTIPFPHQPSSRRTALRIAAGMLIALACTLALWKVLETDSVLHESAAGNVLTTDTLPDGSKVFLNHRSKLTYRDEPRQKKRTVQLSGEGFFEVRHTAEKPFVIQTDEVIIQDIGTAFNVMAYPENNRVEVTVAEGEVHFYTLQNAGLTLRAGEKGIYDKTRKEFSKIEKSDTNVLAYKTKVFRFNNTDLRSVVALINSVYDARITLSSEALNDCRLTVNFNNDKLDTIVEVLSETMGLTVERKDTEIILRGTGCSR